MTSSPLRPIPDYLENPHDGSELTTWIKKAGIDTRIQPDEDAFFAELATAVGHKAYSSQFLDTPELQDSPNIMPHDVHIDPHQDSQFERLNQDTSWPTQGLGAMATHTSGSLDDLSKGLQNVQQNAQQTSKALKEVATSAPTSAPAPAVAATPPTQATPATPSPTTSTPTSSPSPQAPPVPPPGPKPTGVTYTASVDLPSCPECGAETRKDDIDFCPGCGWEDGAELTLDPDSFHSHQTLSEQGHYAFFQSNPMMSGPYGLDAMNANGQYNNMNNNPRTTYFEEGTGDSSFANLHNAPNGNYTRDSLNYGGITDLLIVPPADPRWNNSDPEMHDYMPITGLTVSDPRTAALAKRIDAVIIMAKKLSDEDNPYIRDYSEVRPLNNALEESVNKPELDPNGIGDSDDAGETMHRQPMPRSRAIGPQSLMGQFDPNNQDEGDAPPFVSVVPGAGRVPSYKTQKPAEVLPTFDFVKDH